LTDHCDGRPHHRAPAVAELRRVRKHARVPVLIGSGLTPANIKTYFPLADGFIVGSTFRQGGCFLGTLEPKRLAVFMQEFRGCASGQAARRSLLAAAPDEFAVRHCAFTDRGQLELRLDRGDCR